MRTSILGDICPHNVRTTSHEGYMSHEGDFVRIYISSPGIYARTMSALYPSVFSSGVTAIVYFCRG